MSHVNERERERKTEKIDPCEGAKLLATFKAKKIVKNSPVWSKLSVIQEAVK